VIDSSSPEITTVAFVDLGHSDGRKVWISFKTAEVGVHPR